MASEKRQQRVAEQIRKELSQILLRVNAELFARVTLPEVRLSNDLSHARVFVSVMAGGPGGASRAMRELGKIKRELRMELARRLRIRSVPELSFLHDDSLDRVERVESLLDQIHQEREDEDLPTKEDAEDA